MSRCIDVPGWGGCPIDSYERIDLGWTYLFYPAAHRDRVLGLLRRTRDAGTVGRTGKRLEDVLDGLARIGVFRQPVPRK